MKKALSLILALVMVLGCMSITAFAADPLYTPYIGYYVGTNNKTSTDVWEVNLTEIWGSSLRGVLVNTSSSSSEGLNLYVGESGGEIVFGVGGESFTGSLSGNTLTLTPVSQDGSQDDPKNGTFTLTRTVSGVDLNQPDYAVGIQDFTAMQTSKDIWVVTIDNTTPLTENEEFVILGIPKGELTYGGETYTHKFLYDIFDDALGMTQGADAKLNGNDNGIYSYCYVAYPAFLGMMIGETDATALLPTFVQHSSDSNMFVIDLSETEYSLGALFVARVDNRVSISGDRYMLHRAGGAQTRGGVGSIAVNQLWKDADAYYQSGSGQIKATVTKPLSYDMVIPATVEISEPGITKVGEATVKNVKGASTYTRISYFVNGTDFLKNDNQSKKMKADYYLNANGTAKISSDSAFVVYENKLGSSFPLYVGVTESDWNAAEEGYYTATVTFEFVAEEYVTAGKLLETVDLEKNIFFNGSTSLIENIEMGTLVADVGSDHVLRVSLDAEYVYLCELGERLIRVGNNYTDIMGMTTFVMQEGKLTAIEVDVSGIMPEMFNPLNGTYTLCPITPMASLVVSGGQNILPTSKESGWQGQYTGIETINFSAYTSIRNLITTGGNTPCLVVECLNNDVDGLVVPLAARFVLYNGKYVQLEKNVDVDAMEVDPPDVRYFEITVDDSGLMKSVTLIETSIPDVDPLIVTMNRPAK